MSTRPDGWEWGLLPEPGYAAAWGARLILMRDLPDRLFIPIVHNRQQFTAEPGPDRDTLRDWLNGSGIEQLRRAMVAEDLRWDEAREIRLTDGRITVRADPRSSFGYLYVCAQIAPEAP